MKYVLSVGSSVFAASLGVGVFAGLTLEASAEPVFFDTVALTGDLASSAASGLSFDGSTFSRPAINEAGQTAFVASLGGTGVTAANDLAVFSGGGDTELGLVAREGDALPGVVPDVSFGRFNAPHLNEAGQTAFLAALTGSGVNSSNDSAILSEGGGLGLGLVAREGNAAPGTEAGVNFSRFSLPLFNAQGQTAFFGVLSGADVTTANDGGIWSEGGGSGLRLIAREGNAAPGTASGVNFLALDVIQNTVLNDNGQVAFSATLTGPGVTGSNERGVWSQGGGAGLTLVAREGEAAPGTPTGVSFNSFTTPAINNTGQIAFTAGLTGPGVFNVTGVFLQDQNFDLGLVARTGDAAPGTSAGINFGGLGTPILNGEGQLAFRASLTGADVNNANDFGIFTTGNDSDLVLVAREGAAAPGTEVGVNFGTLLPPVLNGVGQLAFLATLAGDSIVGANDFGIWATGPDGVLALIAREGDLFDVDDNPLVEDFRTISFASILNDMGGEDGESTSFNDAGQLVFQLEFSDGSEGIFVANTALVPEPGALGLVMLGVVGLLRRRR